MTVDKTQARNEWVQGFAYALVLMITSETDKITAEAANNLFQSGIGSIARAVECGVDEADLEVLKRTFQ